MASKSQALFFLLFMVVCSLVSHSSAKGCSYLCSFLCMSTEALFSLLWAYFYLEKISLNTENH